MDDKKEAIIVRNRRLYQSVVSRSAPMQKYSLNISHDALLDSFIVLFEECSKDGLLKDVNVSYFVNKFKALVTEVKHLRIGLCDFELKTVIGRGHFGEVRLVKEKITGDLYSLKTINKAKMINTASAAQFEEERDILSSATSPWLTTLQYAFQDSQNLYIVMEYHPGGDLWSLLEREGGRLPADHARFYLAETLLAIHALHGMGYVHRDIKPDNLLLDRCGHIKLADFGSAARLSFDGRVTTAMLAGTPDYVAPEVLQSLEENDGKLSSYGVECDFWSLGVLAYVIVAGSSPFSGNRTSVIYSKIIKHQASVTYPDGISVTDSLKDLINGFLRPPISRLDYRGARKHVFFVEVDFDSLRQVAPPHMPVVKSPEDTSNFNCDRNSSEPIVTPRENNQEFSGKQLPFVGFTYTPSFEAVDSKIVSDRMPERKSETLEAMKKTNQELLTKLLAAQELSRQREENSAIQRLERSEQEKIALHKELAKERQETAMLRRTIEQDRLDRKQMEEEALTIIRTRTQSMEREHKGITKVLNAKIEELNDRLTAQNTINNELMSKCARAQSEIAALVVELDSVKAEEQACRDKLAKTREYKRRSVSGFESRLDQLQNDYQHRENNWQEKLNAEIEARKEVTSQLHSVLAENAKLLNDNQITEQQVDSLKIKLKAVDQELSRMRVQAGEKSRMKALETQYADKITECSDLRLKVLKLENDLCNHSFLEKETNGQREYVQELETELKKVSQEKIELQSRLQTMKELDKDNVNKLTEVVKKLGVLEQEVVKLENENSLLKENKVSEAKIPSENEAHYQQKILLLEKRIEDLEGQITLLREESVLAKHELSSAQTKLFKTERELSNAKIDIRIAKREEKTAADEVTKLRNELQILKEQAAIFKSEKAMAVEVEMKKNQMLEMELKAKINEIQTLKTVQNKINDLTDSEKQLQSDLNLLRQQLRSKDSELTALKAQSSCTDQEISALKNEKNVLNALVIELRNRVSNLELNNSCLKEASAMLDEQVADYEKFTSEQSKKLQGLQLENTELTRKITQLQSEMLNLREELDNVKEARSEAEHKVVLLDNQVADKGDAIHELRIQQDILTNSIDSLTSRLMEKEQTVSQLEVELYSRDQMIESMQSEVIWLKKESSAHLTNFYSMKETNERITQELDEETRYSEALQERIRELEGVLIELEAFHKQREMKDDATKHQQTKLIAFLQSKLEENKKKKTLAGLFRQKERRDSPPSPQTPSVISPRSVSSKSTENLRKKVLTPPRIAVNSPNTRHAVSQLVDSPRNRMQRQGSLARMHHKIPHRFKTQRISQTGKCVSCFDNIPRGTKASSCIHCNVPAHPKCALTAPKTCGLPSAYVKHFAQTVEKPSEVTAAGDNTNNSLKIEGWIDVMMSGENSWSRKYVKIEESSVLFFETEPDETTVPSKCWELESQDVHFLISDRVEANEIPTAAKDDIPFVIKVASTPNTTCWPSQTHYFLVLKPSDKLKWVAALQAASTCPSDPAPLLVNGKVSIDRLRVVFKDEELGVHHVEELSNNLKLLGCETGLFALKEGSSSPVQLQGVTSVHAIAIAPELNTAVLISGESRNLVSMDYRSLLSNASAAACVSPNIKTDIIAVDTDDPILLFAISSEINGSVFLTAATATKVFVLRWDVIKYCFTVVKKINTVEPCSCILYHNSSVIIGCESFQVLSLNDFEIKDLLNRSALRMSLIRLRSFPMYCAQLSSTELLLCFNEFGFFVNEKGEKTRPDFKWATVPKDFEYCEPFLYVIGVSTVEIIKILSSRDAATDDSSSISTTATLTDTFSVSVNNASLVGRSIYGGIYLSSNQNIYLLEGKKVVTDELESAENIPRVTSEGQFSFTSSVIRSLDNSDSENISPRSGDDAIQHTAL